MAVERTQYTAEFKGEAVRLMTQGDLSAAEVGRELGINPNLLGKPTKPHCWPISHSVGSAVRLKPGPLRQI